MATFPFLHQKVRFIEVTSLRWIAKKQRNMQENMLDTISSNNEVISEQLVQKARNTYLKII